MRNRRIAVLVLLAAAAVLAGCGGGGGGKELTKAQYEQRVQADGKALTQAFASIGSTPASSIDALKTTVAAAETGLGKAADDLASLKPPKEAEAANEAFVAALRAIRDRMGELRQAAEKADVAGVTAVIGELAASKEIAAARSAAAALKAKGYDLGAFGSTG